MKAPPATPASAPAGPPTQADEAAGESADGRSERTRIVGLLHRDLAVVIPGDHRPSIEREVALGMQRVEGAGALVGLCLAGEYDHDQLAHLMPSCSKAAAVAPPL
jgi:hypothetical protein